MEQVRGISYLKESQAVSQATEAAQEKEEGQETSSFEALVQSLLRPDKEENVSEEALFAALIVQRIEALKGQEAAEEFKELLSNTQASMTRADGYIPYEDAARMALKQFQTQGKISADEADKIHSEAFAAAQLDDNLDALYDHIGSAVDPTKAVQQVSLALASAKALIEKYSSGEESAPLRTLDSAFSAAGRPLVNPYDNGSAHAASTQAAAAQATGPVTTGNPNDGPEGFLFKPVSDSNGKLAILMPADISRQVIEVLLRDSSGRVIEVGSHWAPGFGAEGEVNPRKKFSFLKPGAEYPRNLTVEATLQDGSKITWAIADPSKRHD